MTRATLDQTALVADAQRELASMRALRRRLHARPEVGLHLPLTQEAICAELADLPVTVHTGHGLSSVVAVLAGTEAGPVVLLRADMDALPMSENASVDYRSEVPGAMHACGHDLHSAMLVGAVRLLSARQGSLRGAVVFAWQPGEEGGDGMARMLEEGLLDVAGSHPDATFGVHVLAATFEPGTFTARSGASHAATLPFEIVVRGRGGHGGFPHEAADPVPAAAATVLALSAMTTRRFDAHDPVVLTVGVVEAGTAANVIPDRVVLRGTARAFSAENAASLPAAISDVANGSAAAQGLTAEVSFGAGYPPVMNDQAEVALVEDTVAALFGVDRYAPLSRPIPAGDDYAHVLAQVPGAFVLLGAGIPGATAANHNPDVVFDDGYLVDGAALLAGLALRRTGSTP